MGPTHDSDQTLTQTVQTLSLLHQTKHKKDGEDLAYLGKLVFNFARCMSAVVVDFVRFPKTNRYICELDICLNSVFYFLSF